MQLLHYPNPMSQIELLRILLTSTTLNWYSPILEINSPLLYDFEEVMEEFVV